MSDFEYTFGSFSPPTVADLDDDYDWAADSCIMYLPQCWFSTLADCIFEDPYDPYAYDWV